jgi:crotonobetainyl-CoA:carnitine CoA-transferase CaiB-like acyl-CoA transferase
MTSNANTPPVLTTPVLRPLRGVRVLSLALNLPGPAALMRCRQMGASCVKLEAPPPAGAASGASGDPMSWYQRAAYDALHLGVRIAVADLKTEKGQKALHRELAKADVLLTSFRPAALHKLGLDWKGLHKRYPALSQVAIVGAPGARAEEPGHDLTYLAENGLVSGLDLPPTLYADMGGSLMASEAVLQTVLLQRQKGKGSYIEVALSEAAGYLALPRTWGLTTPGAAVGGGHAGYRVYACKDGRVAMAALEPHFAKSLCLAAGIQDTGIATMMAPATHQMIADYLLTMTRKALDKLALDKDIPLYTLSNK